jgi:hypothetical protein
MLSIVDQQIVGDPGPTRTRGTGRETRQSGSAARANSKKRIARSPTARGGEPVGADVPTAHVCAARERDVTQKLSP